MSLTEGSATVTPVGTQSVITFLPDQRVAEVGAGMSLLHAARHAGVHIDAPCGERAKCGKCRVRIVEGHVSPLTAEEHKLLTPGELAGGVRLACVTRAHGAVTVEIPETSRNLAHRKATAELQRPVALAPCTRKICVTVPPPSLAAHDLRDDLARLKALLPAVQTVELSAVRDLHQCLQEGRQTVTALIASERLLAVESGDTTARHYGVALDIGTTTVVGYLMDLHTGAELAAFSQPNPQAAYGADVISRIEFAQGHPERVEQLRSSVTNAINHILQSVAAEAGITPELICEMTVVGNTCMSHLFLGVDPLPLGRAPYVPVLTDPMTVPSAELGLALHPRGLVRTLPNIAGFVGADTVGVLAASDLDKLQGLHVAVDIGTNAEVMVGVNGRIIACSTAAGPAFEGAKISQGMRAQAGAIDGVTIGEDLFVHTIGERPAQGICGSGIIDAIGELCRVEMLESSGRFADPADLPHLPPALTARMVDDGVVLVWGAQSAHGRDIILTQQDVREVQLVKAAIYAGIATLLEKIGHRPDELDGLLIAGAFGTYITKEHAVRIGLIPDIPLDKLTFLGNAAGAGAKMALLSHTEYTAICAAARQAAYVELAGDETFRDNFMMAMMLAPGCED